MIPMSWMMSLTILVVSLLRSHWDFSYSEAAVGDGHIAPLDDANVLAGIPDGDHLILVDDMRRERHIDDAAS